MTRRNNWIQQLVSITQKGYAAFEAGQPTSANPYQEGYNGGGGLQRQRRKAWADGWRLARRDQKEKAKERK